MMDIMDKSVAYNNAGVECFNAGRDDIAWDLFKGALEIKLADEQTDQSSGGAAQTQPLLPAPPVVESGSSAATNGNSANVVGVGTSWQNNVFVQKAEVHYSNLSQYITTTPHQVPTSVQAQDMEVVTNAAPETPCDDVVMEGAQQTAGAVPPPTAVSHAMFLSRQPIRLQRRDDASATRQDSATIIYNLAIVDHIRNMSSEQAVSLYELSMTLVTGDKVDILGMSLVNNIGVWCYENGDATGATTCMMHLLHFMNRCVDADLSASDLEGFHANILWILHPPCLASAAA